MKRRILGVLLMLLLLMGSCLTVNAAITKETYFTENGVRYCWLRGELRDDEVPSEKVKGYTWVKVSDEDGLVTQIGACDSCAALGIMSCDCIEDGDPWALFDRLEHKFELVKRELLTIECRDELGNSMKGVGFMLLVEPIVRDDNDNPILRVDENGKRWVQRYEGLNDTVICKAIVGANGRVTLRLEDEIEDGDIGPNGGIIEIPDEQKEAREKLKLKDAFEQVILVQNMNPDPDVDIENSDILNEYKPIEKRWYVNLRLVADDEYEVCGMTEAPFHSTDNYDELITYGFYGCAEDRGADFGKGFDKVPEYSTKNQLLILTNEIRYGTIQAEINVEGLQGSDSVDVYFDVFVPDTNISDRLRNGEIMEKLRMREYSIKFYQPPVVNGYTQKDPELKIEYASPVNSEPKPLEVTGNTSTILLDRDHVNAKLILTYTYHPDHKHDYDYENGVVTDPTCTAQGYTTYKCKDPECTDPYKVTDIVEKIPHKYEEELVKPTCYEDGYIIYDCKGCAEHYEYHYEDHEDEPEAQKLKKLDHEYELKVTKPTCTENGYTTYTCIHCADSYPEVDEETALGHEEKITKTQAASCEEDAKVFKYCTECGDKWEESEEGTKLGHDYNFDSPKIIEATCTQAGYEQYTCSRSGCGKKLNGEPLADKPALGHTYDSGKVTNPTCTEKGYTTYTCTVKGCGYSYSGNYTNAAGHKYVEKVVEPTKTQEGYTEHTCSVCGDSYTDNHKDKLSNKKPSSGSSGSSSNKGQTANKNNTNMSGSATDTLVVKFYDNKNQPLNSGMVGLYSGNTQLKTWSCTYDNVVVVDNLEKYATDGAVVALTLKQSKAMDGYDVSKDSFTVQLQKDGSNLKINVKKNGSAFSGTSKATKVEKGRDGKPIVSICNTKKTTQFDIACQVSVEFDDSCLPDDVMPAELLQNKYKFTLNWTNDDGEQKSESISLVNGTSGSWKAKIPFGTKYEITATDSDGNAVRGLSENASGTLSAKQMEGKVKVEAAIQYKVQSDSPKTLEMNVVDPATGTPLKGANFELRDPEGAKIATFISRENGKFYMEDAFQELGDYLLIQSKATDGYASVKGDVPVIVSLAYAPQSENNVQTILQSKAVEFAHQAVSSGEGEVYTIENDSQIVIDKNTGKGGKTGLILGIVGGTVAVGAGGAAAFVMIKKKRKQG